LQRRARLFVECVRQLADDPLAQPAARGVPIGDGCGMERLVARIDPIFARERSLLRWVALRGALAQLYIMTVDDSSAALPFSPAVETAMGVGDVAPPGATEPVIGVGREWASRLSAEQRQAVVEVFSALAVRVFDYERYSQMSIDEVNQDPRCRLNDAMALDFIAWSAVALLRTELAQSFLHAPEPDALEQPGWYTDPLWGKAQRYWDGDDWTERVRASGGQEAILRLRPPNPQPSRPAQAGPTGPTVSQVLAEWDSGSPAADVARWREGMARYDAAPVENRAEMRASAELMCAALTHYLRGTDIFAGSPDIAGSLAQTIWTVLVASLLGNDQSTWDAQVERHVRLALATARHAGLQPESLGGRGTLNRIFEDQGNQMLMQAALWDISRSGPKSFTLRDWFTVNAI
jgi:Protein of unknown function (DUF2510)